MIAAASLLAVVSAEEQGPLIKILTALGNLRSPGQGSLIPDGRTWGDLSFIERVKIYNWSTELYVLATFAVFILFYLWGKKANEKKVYDFYNYVKPKLDENFGYVGASPAKAIIKDSDSRYTTYASGRDNIESLLVRFRLLDRQNILSYGVGLVVPSLASVDGKPDHIEITLQPTNPRAIEPEVFGVINKDNLAEAQEENYAFGVAKPLDSDKLPSPVYIFMLEHSDQIEALLTPELKSALSLEGADKVLRWIYYSDVPKVAPKTEQAVTGFRKLQISLNFPKNAAQYEAAKQILDAAFGLVDLLVSKPAYRATTVKRIKANRDVEVNKVRKAEEAAKKEELENKKAEERREAARRERNLSEKEQRKLHKKEQEKLARKQRAKATKRS